MGDQERKVLTSRLGEIETDLVVIGGGLSGCLAAIAAKLTNPSLDIWVIERYGFLGGMATAGYVYPFMRYFTRMPDGSWKSLSGGLFRELTELLHNFGYCEKKASKKNFYSRFDPMMMRMALDHMVLNQDIHILFHNTVNKVEIHESAGKIHLDAVYAQSKSGELKISGKFFIDATGDADLVYHMGGKTTMGRDEDGHTQPATLNFRMGNISKFHSGRSIITAQIKSSKAKGELLTPRDDCLMFMGKDTTEMHFNQTRVAKYNFTDPFDLSAAEIEGRMQAERFIKFLRTEVKGFKHSRVMNIGTQLGIRESRRIVGEYILTEKDLVDCVHFEDRIALGNYSIDIHDPLGSAKTRILHIPKGKWYSIPYRTLIPQNVANVLVAGRPISSTHEAHSAIRVMPICSIIGHGAGTALGLLSLQSANENGYDVRDVDIKKLQTVLRTQRAVLE